MRIFLIALLTVFTHFSTFAQDYPKLENTLSKNFPNDSVIVTDGRWVFNSETSKNVKIQKPLVNKYISDFDLFEVMLTNYLGYHIENSNCLILFNRTLNKAQLVQPLWFSGISPEFLKLFIGSSF